MSSTDCRSLNFYRLPIYQKRIIGIENRQTNSHARSPSPNRSIFASRRRHSTPPGTAKHWIDVNTPPANRLIKYYHSYPRRGCVTNEQNFILEPSSRPSPFVKFRHQEERGTRLVTTPTSIKSFTDIVLPIAKKNRSTIIETSTTNPSEIQSINHSQSSAKRGRKASLNPEHDVFISNEDTRERTLSDDRSTVKSIKWCHAKCPCRFSHCNLCHWYCSCPFCCWIVFFVLAFALLTGIFLSIRFFSN